MLGWSAAFFPPITRTGNDLLRPDHHGAHSPDEAVQIDTVGRCHQWLLMCLQALAEGEGKA